MVALTLVLLPTPTIQAAGYEHASPLYHRTHYHLPSPVTRTGPVSPVKAHHSKGVRALSAAELLLQEEKYLTTEQQVAMLDLFRKPPDASIPSSTCQRLASIGSKSQGISHFV
ncbi:hypothetical protein JB92DRAFT_3106689 [Gautieria morchelliformis]|nr:hypothetical protein JB92DRAFT_3106689 [Gautieria morchelliformis]